MTDEPRAAALSFLAEAFPGLTGAARAAAASAPVLILGEPGSGRSTLARALHEAGPRADGPLVELDPGSVPGSLFEGELFGWRRGAFTGAESDRAGRIERAAGGTLVLDRIESLPLAAQPKLLRLLAEGTFTPLGGDERPADARLIAIGPEDLGERIAAGLFREDLYYRLEVLAFRLPPLRMRRDELPSLLDRLLADLASRMGRPVPRLGDRARRWIGDYAWPGNLRQLRNVLERALVMGDGEELDPDPPTDRSGPPRSLAAVEADEIRRALAYTGGRKGAAAELLGISRKALWEKRKRYGIP